MTEKPEHFLPGDVVERTGESVLSLGMVTGRRYTVREVTLRGWLTLAAATGDWPSRGFKLIKRPEK